MREAYIGSQYHVGMAMGWGGTGSASPLTVPAREKIYFPSTLPDSPTVSAGYRKTDDGDWSWLRGPAR